MRYSLKFLQRAGLVSTLLIGGVLGGLIAPLHSEAGTPEITLQIDGLPTTTAPGYTLPGIPLRGAKLTSCNAADVGLNYTDCYAILTSNTTAYEGKPATDGTKRYWRVQVAPNQTARLRIGDNVGQDLASLIGVAFVPVTTATQAVTAVTDWGNVSPTYANTLEQHVLTIKTTNNFDSTVNVNNATGVAIPNSGTPPKTVGQVAHGLRSGGEFDAGPLNVVTKLCVATTTTNGVTTVNSPVATAKCDAVNNNVNFTGMGKFTTGTVPILSPAGSANNSQALSLTVGAGSKELPKVNWPGTTNATLGQVDPTYPRFDCILSSNSTQCKPIMTYTMTATMKGPDTFVVTGGPDHFSANCTTEAIKNFNSSIIYLASAVATADKWEKAHHNPILRAIINDIKAFLVIFNTRTDPTCPGANVVRVKMFIAALQDQLVYMANGSVQADIAPPPPTGTITITKHVPCGDCTGQSGVVFTFHIDGPSPSTQMITTNGSDNTSITVPVLAGHYSVSEDAASGWQLDSSACVDSGPTTGFDVFSGGNVTCTFNNIKSPTTGTITIIKNTFDSLCVSDCSLPDGTFNFQIDDGEGPLPSYNPQIIINDGSGTKTLSPLTVVPGTYNVGEVDQGGGWSVSQSDCGGMATSSSVVTNVVVPLGGNVTCTFRNGFANPIN